VSEDLQPKKLYILAAIVIVASGSIAWGLVSLYRADDAWQDQDTYSEEDNLEAEGLADGENEPEDPAISAQKPSSADKERLDTPRQAVK